MPFALDVQLDVDASRDGLPGLAYGWIDHLTSTLATGPRDACAGLPAGVLAAQRASRPGEPFGQVSVARWPVPKPEKRALSSAGLAWLRAQFEEELPTRVYVETGELGDRPGFTGTDLMAEVVTYRESPGWLRLSAFPPDTRFADPAVQRRWLDALFAFADRVDPGFGQISYHYHGDTALEQRTDHSRYGIERRDVRYALGHCREWLRGYSWLTIVPSGLAGKLGGAQALRATGAFHEVRELAAGGVWLLATEDFRSYDLEVAWPVFRALAPVLPPGLPLDFPPSGMQPPLIVVPAKPDSLGS
jgi:hypothetical protein